MVPNRSSRSLSQALALGALVLTLGALPQRARATVRPARRDHRLHLGGRRELLAQQESLLRQRREFPQPGAARQLACAGRLPQRHAARAHGGVREAARRSAGGLDALFGRLQSLDDFVYLGESVRKTIGVEQQFHFQSSSSMRRCASRKASKAAARTIIFTYRNMSSRWDHKRFRALTSR